MTQLDMLQNAANAAWNAHVHNVELEAQRQYEHDMTAIKAYDILSNDPSMATNLAINTIGTSMSYIGVLSATGAISLSPPVGIVVSVVGLICSVWGEGSAAKDFLTALNGA